MVRVDIFSDVVCPWCFVGKRRLEQAVALLRGRHAGREIGVRVEWKPFELNPGMPRGGVERAAYRQAKFGSLEQSRMLDARLLEVGRSAGIPFAFDKIQRTPNTFDAHRLLRLAGQEGDQNALAEALFRAYFLEGRDIGGHAVLADLAESCGLPRARAASLLAGDEGAREVRMEEDRAWRSGIQGVPHFLIDGAPSISGAQNPEIIASALEDALAHRAET